MYQCVCTPSPVWHSTGSSVRSAHMDPKSFYSLLRWKRWVRMLPVRAMTLNLYHQGWKRAARPAVWWTDMHTKLCYVSLHGVHHVRFVGLHCAPTDDCLTLWSSPLNLSVFFFSFSSHPFLFSFLLSCSEPVVNHYCTVVYNYLYCSSVNSNDRFGIFPQNVFLHYVVSFNVENDYVWHHTNVFSWVLMYRLTCG